MKRRRHRPTRTVRPAARRPWPLLLLLAVAGACGGSGSGDRRSDGADTGAAGGEAAAPDPERELARTVPWRTGPVSEAADGSATLVSVRTGRHEDYDRLVMEFRGGVPGYTVQFPTRPLHQCGSGQPIEVDAPQRLQIELHSAAAHDEQGQPTIAERDRQPRLPVLRSARLTCDFEGVVEWVLGLEERTEFRVLKLPDPTRLVVDIRHP